ncbi:MAG: hypothetical protein HY344_00620 [Candidatus Levybacteria bacterium]|nr:hypothetical protein [Candidatus Levybacteria bacterium]
MKIISVGDIGIDEYVDLGIKKPGGIAFNFAVNVIKNNTDCSLLSVIGKDQEGKQLKNLLHSLNIDISHLQKVNGKTAKQNIALKENGERKFVGYNAGVFNKWHLSKKDINFILKHNVVFVSLSDGLEDIVHAIANLQGNITKIIDFSQDYKFADFESEDNLIAKHCINFDIIFIGGNEKLIKRVKTLGAKFSEKLFILTLGNQGSLAFQNDRSYFQKAKKIKKIIDTTGCGDAFQAGFVTAYLNNKDIQQALNSGAKQAESVITHIGSTELNL